MQNITVDKAEVLATIRSNREAHAEQYADAVKVYREKVTAWHREQADKIEAGGEIAVFPSVRKFPKPEEHTDDYDRAIKMLEWDKSEQVEMDEYTFQCLVLNDWPWRASFAANTESYMAE